MDKIAVERWAREAVSLALYECFLSVAAEMQKSVEDIQVEAAWRSPSTEEWLMWRTKRKFVNDGTFRQGD